MGKIAILGATGHIGKALTYRLSSKTGFEVFLFARSFDRLQKFVSEIKGKNKFNVHPIGEFGRHEYDVVINCVGFGNPSVAKDAGTEIFRVTEEFDNLVLGYLRANKETLYVNPSSGAVYGKSFYVPVDKNTKTMIDVNNMGSDDYYSIAKINSESKHRSLPNLNIVDLRIFSFFSRFIELDSGFLVSEIIKNIREGSVLKTSSEDMVRDYVSPDDLLELIVRCSKRKSINDFFDVYSRAPVTKFDLLNYFKNNYGLKYKIKENANVESPTGPKYAYYSTDRKAEGLGYVPKFSSMDCIKREIKGIL